MTPELEAARKARGLPPYRHEGAPRYPYTVPCITEGCPLPSLDYGTRCWRCSLARERAQRKVQQAKVTRRNQEKRRTHAR